MNHGKTVFSLAIAAAVVTPVATAVDIKPGTPVKVTSNTSNLTDTTSDLPLNFSQSNSVLQASVPEGFPSQTGSITLTYSTSGNQSNTTSETLQADIIGYSDWELNIQNFADNLSVGDTGRAGTLNLTQNGNTKAEIRANATGNLSKFLSVDDQFRLFPQNTIRKTISYSIPRDTQFGEYRATINYTEPETDLYRAVNLSTVFEDNIQPEIQSVSFPDVMSTRNINFTVDAQDNYNITGVEADILREVEQIQGNETVTVNNSVTTLIFNENGQKWRSEFTQTDQIGQYYYNLTVEDSAGNTVSQVGEFNVKGLDAVDVVTNNFEFDSVYPTDASGGVIDDKQSKAEKTVFTVSEPTDVDIRLQNFQHSVENSSITIGVLPPGESVANNFDLEEETPSLSFSETGDYRLVVESNSVESFSGELNITLVPQHVNGRYRQVVFDGLVTNPEYPPEQSWTIKGYNASLEYLNQDNSSQPDVLKRTLTAPADICRGFSSAEECPEINDFQSIVDQVKEENQQLENQVSWVLLQRNIAVLASLLFLAGYVRSKNLAGKHVAVTPVKK